MSKKERVYVVDRENRYGEFLSRAFEKENADIIVQSNSVKALYDIKKTVPDLVIIYDTPVIDGISTCCFIKKDIRSCNIPVIILSSKNENNFSDDYSRLPASFISLNLSRSIWATSSDSIINSSSLFLLMESDVHTVVPAIQM